MKTCASCGASCPDSASFCTNCGAVFIPIHTHEGQGEETQNASRQDSYVYPQEQYRQNTQTYYAEDPYRQENYGYSQGAYPPSTYPQYSQYSGQRNAPYVRTGGVSRRSIVLAIIFTLITFGIYGIYWMIRINDDVNQLAEEPNATSGGLVFLFSLITFGIYRYYWLYKMGERCDKIKGEYGGIGPILYLILGLLGLSIVSYALIQDTVNKCIPAS